MHILPLPRQGDRSNAHACLFSHRGGNFWDRGYPPRRFFHFAATLQSGQYVLSPLLLIRPSRLRMRHRPERFRRRPLSLPQLSQMALTFQLMLPLPRSFRIPTVRHGRL